MATFKICVFEHQKREDGKYPVSIRVTNNRKTAYISTGNYVTRSQIDRSFKYIKDNSVIRSIDKQIQKYEDLIKDKLGVSVNSYSVRELCEFLKQYTNTSSDIDFIAFAWEHIKTIRSNPMREAYAKKIESTLLALIDFFDRDTIFIKEINSKSLQSFADYLQSERIMTRKARNGCKSDTIVTKRKAVSDRTISDYITNIRTLFNAAIEKYNDEDLGVTLITHYPFRRFKIKSIQESKKRNLSIDQILSIRNLKITTSTSKCTRINLAKDIFMLSFYLVGMNLADLYEVTDYRDGRISYNRRKTSGRREDKAFISIKVEPEAVPLIEKYRDKTGKRVFCFYQMYRNHQNFAKNVNAGLKQVASATNMDIPLTSYYARHSWATIARNDCKISKDDINLALNHVDNEMKVTDIYIAKDWTIIDEANRQVIDAITKDPYYKT
jgi:integrase